MRKTLEDFYYGNIVPCERQMTHGSELKKAADRIAHYENSTVRTASDGCIRTC